MSFLGGCCTGTPGPGASGPVGACASRMPAAVSPATSSHNARHPWCLIVFIPAIPRRSLPDQCTHFDAVLPEDVAGDCLEFPQSTKLSMTGCKPGCWEHYNAKHRESLESTKARTSSTPSSVVLPR